MALASIDFPGLVCASVIAETALREPRRIAEFRLTPQSQPVQIATVADVLYVPDMRTQIVDGRIVPMEAIYETWSLDHERNNGFWGRAKDYQQPFEAAYADDEVAILSNFYSRNFYHWVAEELVKVAILERSGFTGRYVLANLPAFAADFMTLVGVPHERLIRSLPQPTVFRSVVYTTAIRENLLDHADIFRALHAALVAAAGAPATRRGKRLWLDRGVGVARDGVLVNKDEVYPVLARHGFEVVDMATLPVAEQIATVHAAEAIGGPHGAAFVHCLFMPEHSAVIECFSPAFINPCVLELCRVMHHRYAMLVPNNAFGIYTYGRDLKIDCMHLELVLETLGD